MSADRPISRWGKIATFTVLLSLPVAACAGQPGAAPQTVTQNATAMFVQTGVALSPSAQRVSRIAAQNGDQNYLMIDKTAGQIITFERGVPTFSGAALTGESLTDVIPPDAFYKSFAETRGLKYKVTPAGRFTVSPGYDHAYGETLDVNEVQGEDWDISIHRVWLGAPAEHRDLRLRTAGGEDKHITYGCIDVDAETMRQLLLRAPHEARIPLYIVPVNEGSYAYAFRPNEPVREAVAPVTTPKVRLAAHQTVR